MTPNKLVNPCTMYINLLTDFSEHNNNKENNNNNNNTEIENCRSIDDNLIDEECLNTRNTSRYNITDY